MKKLSKLFLLVFLFASSLVANNSKTQDFVERFYVSILDRQGDEAGIKYWVDELSSGKKSGADIAKGFIHSAEFTNRNTTDEEYVNILYKAFFNREADKSGFQNWVDRLSSGASRDEVLEGFLYSSEFNNLSKEYCINAVTPGNIENCNSTNNINDVNITISELTNEQKYSLAYMWHEEKLAKDIYLALNEITPHQTLYNIAVRSEVEHEQAVETLVEKYDINITNLQDYKINYSKEELEALAPGQYAIPQIQELYNLLYDKGSKSLQDALEVGCMVEVTDIEDLNKYIEIAKNREDLTTTFIFLRNGSYNHYWAFNQALKNLGISEGCCSLGEKYCKTTDEYPSSHGNYLNGNGYHGGR